MKRIREESENLRGSVKRDIQSRTAGVTHQMRMSLTLRIAVYYGNQVLRSFPLALTAVLLALVLCRCLLYGQAEKRVLAFTPASGEEYTQEIILHPSMDVTWMEEEGNPPALSFFQRVGLFFQSFPDSLTLQRTVGQRVLTIHYLLAQDWLYLLWAVLTLVFIDLLRIAFFMMRYHRLDRLVVRPIRSMADLASRVSASNLSDRIDTRFVQNEFQDLADVINRMLDRLEVSYNSQKQFVSDASHELRTPIAVVQGYADMLIRWGSQDSQVLEEGLAAIQQEANNMKDLVQDLLFLARHDKKTLMMDMSEFDPSEVLREVHRETEMVHPEYHFQFSALESCLLQADRNMFKQVIRILVDNAVKYTPEGGQITMGVCPRDSVCELIVQDTGCGISAEDMPRIFDRFYRADKARKSESGGHGLGLSIARIIVVAHGGKIRVRSKEGEGSVFIVQLPLRQNFVGETPVSIDISEKNEPILSRLRGKKLKA